MTAERTFNARDLELLDRVLSEFTSETRSTVGFAEIDPELAHTIRVVDRVRRSRGPERAFAESLSGLLASTAATMTAEQTRPTSPFGVLRLLPARVKSISMAGEAPLERANQKQRQWGHHAFASIALVLILVVAAGGLWNYERVNQTPTAHIAPGAHTEVTGVAKPATGPLQTSISRISLPPGRSYRESTGPTTYLVEQGQIVLKMLDTGSRSDLLEGQASSTPDGSNIALINEGTEPAIVITAGVYTSICPKTSPGVKARILALVALPSHPGYVQSLTLANMTIPAGAAMPVWTTDALTFLVVTDGALRVALSGESAPTIENPDTDREIRDGRVERLVPGVTVAARNDGDTPVTVTIVTTSAAE